MKYLLLSSLLTLIVIYNTHSQCQQCEQELKDTRNELNKIEKDLNSKMKELRKQLNDCLKNQQEPNKECEARIQELNTKNEDLIIQLDSLNNKLQKYISNNNDYIKRLGEVDSQIVSCRSNLIELKNHNIILLDSIKILENLSPDEKKSRIKNEIERLIFERNSKSRDIDSSRMILSNLQSEYKEVVSLIESKNLALKEINDDIRNLQIAKDLLTSEVYTLKLDKDRREIELNNVIRNFNQENTILNNLKDDISNKESKLRSLKSEISKTESRLSDLESKLPAHFSLGFAISSNWNYGFLDEKYAQFDINSWNGRVYLGYCLDHSKEKWDGRDRTTIIGLFLNYGTISKNNLMQTLSEQNVDIMRFDSDLINQFYEIEGGIIVDEIAKLSLGYGNQNYAININNLINLKNIEYMTFTFGLQAPLYEYLDFGLSSTFQYGLDYQKLSARFGFYLTVKLNFLRW